MKSESLLLLTAHCGQLGILVCVTALLCAPTEGRAAVITLTLAADTFIYSGSPDNNAGANPWFGVGTDGHGEARRGLLRFNLGSIRRAQSLAPRSLVLYQSEIGLIR